MTLPKRDRRCHLVTGYAAEGTSLSDANAAFNAYVADKARGLVLFHDHFTDRAGGIAIFAVETEPELAALEEPGPLAGWELAVHPLIFAEGALGFLFQIDYTMLSYRKRRLPELMREYEASDLCTSNDARA